jgi:hypothetical protein
MTVRKRYSIFLMLTASDIDNSQATTTIPIRWKEDVDKALRGIWGKGPASTEKRARRLQRELLAIVQGAKGE